jgi:hypothetical protein
MWRMSHWTYANCYPTAFRTGIDLLRTSIWLHIFLSASAVISENLMLEF